MGTIIQVVCSNCQKDMGTKPGEGMEGISHSICEPCLRELYSDFTEEEIQEIMKGGATV